jgi:hypothetical protein
MKGTFIPRIKDTVNMNITGRILNEEEVKRLLDNCDRVETREAITMAFYEGMTLSQILFKIPIKRTTLQARLTKLSNKVLGFQSSFAKLRNSTVIYLFNKGYTAEYINEFMGYSRKDILSYKTRIGGYIRPKLRLQVLTRDKFACVYCNGNKQLEVDHILPRTKGGKTILENLQTLCTLCNRAKGNTEVISK